MPLRTADLFEALFRRCVFSCLLVALPGAALGQESREPSEATLGEGQVVQGTLLGAPGHREVEAVRPLVTDGGRLDWSRQGKWIAYDRAGEDGLYDIWLLRVEGGDSEKCLTCEHWDFKKVNALDPVWHPSGEFVFFRVQQNARRMKLDASKLSGPLRGMHSDIWVIDRHGKYFHQLTRAAEQGGAVVDHHISYEGDQVVWTERLENDAGRWGTWGLRVAPLKERGGVVRFGKVKTLRPTEIPGFTMAHGFTPNDRGLLVSALSSAGDIENSRDLFRLELESGQMENLTSSPRYRDAHVSVAPRNSDLLVWVSDRGIQTRGRPLLPFRGDLWLLDQKTGGQERLTFFNDPDSDHTLGHALIDDLSWSPEGDRLAIHVVSAGGTPKRRVVVKPGGSAPPPVEDLEPVVRESIQVVEFRSTFVD